MLIRTGSGSLKMRYLRSFCLTTALTFFTGCYLLCAEGKAETKKEITVYYAAGLNTAMNKVIKEFNGANPSINVIGESGGSLFLIRKITELHTAPDVLFVADAAAIKSMLIDKYADWYVKFYKDRIVLAYTDRSKYTNEIDANNWYEVLLRKDVRYGYANPNQAPVGYRTLMVWQLADSYYKAAGKSKANIYEELMKNCPGENILPDVAEMLHLLESLYLDYAFVYESTAKQHNLQYLKLPPEIDLGDEKFAGLYKKAKVEVVSKKIGDKETMTGSPVVFALTILKDTADRKEAVEFVRFFLGPKGREILRSSD